MRTASGSSREIYLTAVTNLSLCDVCARDRNPRIAIGGSPRTLKSERNAESNGGKCKDECHFCQFGFVSRVVRSFLSVYDTGVHRGSMFRSALNILQIVYTRYAVLR